MRKLLLFALLLPAGARAFADPSVDRLLRDLATDSPARVTASQLLPRHGVEPVADLLRMLADPSPSTGRAAFLVVWETLNELAAPGRTDDANRAADLVLAALADAPSDAVKRELLRLAAIAVPEGHGVSAVTDLLGDPAWREPARTTLERINTAEARTGLRDAIDPADPDFTVALLNSLGQVRDADAVARALELTGDPSPAVRAAAARAVAWTGEPRAAKPLRQVVAQADDVTRFDATDALLKLADSIAQAGGNFDLAMQVYSDVLASTPIGVLREAAIVGLATYGDERVVETILAAANGADVRTDATAIASLALVRGAAATEAICRAYATQPDGAKLRMIPGLGRRGGAPVVPLLTEAAASDDAAIRLAALRALGDVPMLDVLPTLVAAMANGTDEERPIAIASAKSLAETLRGSGNADNAGKVYAELFRAAPDQSVRDYAMDGIRACPVPEAFEAILQAGGDVDIASLPGPVLVSVASALLKVGRLDDAKKLLDTILGAPLVGEAAERLLTTFGTQADLDVPHRMGIVPKWRIVGPFPFGGPGTGLDVSNVSEPNVDLAAGYAVDVQTLKWQPVDATASYGLVDLTGAFGMPQKRVAYAFTRVSVDRDTDVAIRSGSDDGIKIWVNGAVVHSHDIDRPNKFDDDAAPAKLKAGPNDILVMITQGGGGWNFRLRVTTPEGVGVPVDVVE